MLHGRFGHWMFLMDWCILHQRTFMEKFSRTPVLMELNMLILLEMLMDVLM